MIQSHPRISIHDMPNPTMSAPSACTLGFGSSANAKNAYPPNTTAVVNAVKVRARVGSTGIVMPALYPFAETRCNTGYAGARG